MKHQRDFTALARTVLGMLLIGISTLAIAASVEETRAHIRTHSQEVLTRLYAAQPGAREAIAKSAGYATFSKWGLKLGAVGGGIGRGLAVERPSGKETFMSYVEGSAGLGFGIKKYALVFVFANEQARDHFIDNGWEAGAQAVVAAKRGSAGNAYEGAASVSPGVWVYQITDEGLAAEIGLQGTKYYKDKTLN